MNSEYLPIGLMILVAVGFACISVFFSWLVSQKGKPNPAKDSPYECGLPSMMEDHPRFSVKFYRVAMLFILFDIEIVFLYPWAVVYKELLLEGSAVFWSMFSFLAILFIGFLYALKKGALNWK